MIAPVGRWWLAYSDGSVWPCEVLGPSVMPGYWRVRPMAPAPKAGTECAEPRRRIYDSAFNHPAEEKRRV